MQSDSTTTANIERALLVQVVIGRQLRAEAEDSLAELARLADTAGSVVVGAITQHRDRPDPALMIGQGKLAEVQLAGRAAEANLLIFDNELSAVQAANVRQAAGLKVIDRTELILRIFARRAQTAEAKIQVELAQLQYLAGRIPVLEAQQRFQGGIGMRGPGESPMQLRRAPMLARITVLKRKLKEIQRRRQLTRRQRQMPEVCLVGYTNAGKSTLLNACSAADAYVDDRLFATLDTKSRAVFLPDRRQVMLTDTVGFIRHLPHGLVASFRSTLEEIGEADLLLLVLDAGHRYLREHLAVVEQTLAEIQAERAPRLLLFNKIDTPAAQAALPELQRDFPDALALSALRREGVEALKERMAQLLAARPPEKFCRSEQCRLD